MYEISGEVEISTMITLRKPHWGSYLRVRMMGKFPKVTQEKDIKTQSTLMMEICYV